MQVEYDFDNTNMSSIKANSITSLVPSTWPVPHRARLCHNRANTHQAMQPTRQAHNTSRVRPNKHNNSKARLNTVYQAKLEHTHATWPYRFSTEHNLHRMLCPQNPKQHHVKSHTNRTTYSQQHIPQTHTMENRGHVMLKPT